MSGPGPVGARSYSYSVGDIDGNGKRDTLTVFEEDGIIKTSLKLGETGEVKEADFRILNPGDHLISCAPDGSRIHYEFGRADGLLAYQSSSFDAFGEARNILNPPKRAMSSSVTSRPSPAELARQRAKQELQGKIEYQQSAVVFYTTKIDRLEAAIKGGPRSEAWTLLREQEPSLKDVSDFNKKDLAQLVEACTQLRAEAQKKVEELQAQLADLQKP